MKNAQFWTWRREIAVTLIATGSAVALVATAGAGVSHASEGPVSIPASSLSADGKFFTPGPNTVVKRNAGATETRSELAQNVAPVSPAPAGTTDYYAIKNAHWISQSCGTNVIQQTSGQGKTTLVLSVEKSVAATVTKEVNVDLKYISAGMGWSVTNTYSVKNETRYEVPSGKFGTVQAFPLYDVFVGDAWSGAGGRFPTGKKVYAYKPVGVCFNQWLR
ncbi:hypothetical protein MTF65_10980 [Streptomyces sp. APSN-46.1]|uniref:hypothetical protein n=1 Tax=Streptomyces sp. APSN-46.1 TaxID=2929049 RepID=UPI001FB38521|nr:hypothetical protein [Streptomyces sp. APSN-46.1]MCJ1677857.1 hypothetical protein [Streptomyces sp. APSN-46.1]